ncbi:hypothetical protein D3C80_1566970 [compost metagenome]
MLGHADSSLETLLIKADRALIKLFGHAHSGARTAVSNVQLGQGLFDGGRGVLNSAGPLLEKVLDFHGDTPRPFGVGLGPAGKFVQLVE